MTLRAFFEFLHHRRVHIQVAFVVLVMAVYLWADTFTYAPTVEVMTWSWPSQKLYSWRNDLVGLIEDTENGALDWRVRLRGVRTPPEDIVIIGIDESAFDQPAPWSAAELAKGPELAYLNKPWPWDHALWGRMTDKLLKAGAKLVVFDLVFASSSPGDAVAEKDFANGAGKLVIASQYDQSTVGTQNTVKITGPVDDLVPPDGPEIVGIANVQKDRDGIERKFVHGFNPLLLNNPELGKDPAAASKYKINLFTMSWMAAEKVLGHPPDRNPGEAMYINYYGEPGAIQPLHIGDVLDNWDTLFGQFFKDKYVFVGPWSEVRFKDLHATPMGLMEGVEIQATAFYNLIEGAWLRPAPDWFGSATVVLFGLLSLLICLRIHHVLPKIGTMVAIGAGYWQFSQWTYEHDFIMLPVVGAGLGIIVCGGFGTIFDFVLEQYERRRMLGVFESMVSPGVAGLVLSHRDDFEKRLGGQRKELVVLFSDIRSFTKWSEKVGPDALVSQLNEYFLEMVEIIQQEGGTVQKYIGDALMAAWGDVREQPAEECATQAVRAALRMVEALRKLNAGWEGRPAREKLKFGVGINFGESVVGQIGHPRRQEFTVMGDAVNLANRFESATKQYHQTILVGDGIYQLTRDKFFYRMADKMQVMGKTYAVPVYVPMGERTGTVPLGLAEYEAAIEKYYARDFTGAAALFKTAQEKMGGDDFLCENYHDRSLYFADSPPPSNWDGAWVLKEK